jgi:hypothetical protein
MRIFRSESEKAAREVAKADELAVQGAGHAEIELSLRSEFGIKDPERIADQILGAAKKR